MKKLITLSFLLVGLLTLSACDLIQEEIERAESIELEDVAVLIHERSVLLKITSDADEQVIEDVVVNDEQYELVSQGDDWYLLEDVPLEKSYSIGDIYYRTAVGVRLSFNVDYDFEIEDGLNRIPNSNLTTIDDTVTINAYTFSPSDEELVTIDSDQDYVVDKLTEWAWVVLDDNNPAYVVVEYNDIVYVIEAPDTVSDYIED